MTEHDAYRRRIAGIHERLGLAGSGGPPAGWSLHVEPPELQEAGPDYYGRPQQLYPPALDAWKAMQAAAAVDGVVLHLISAFRSVDYQYALIRRKLDEGRSLEEIMRVNALPGYSEHHTGRAVDLGTEHCPALEEEFEGTPAFRWLDRHAADFGFHLSYPRDNALGVAYEPWHWCFHEDGKV